MQILTVASAAWTYGTEHSALAQLKETKKERNKERKKQRKKETKKLGEN